MIWLKSVKASWRTLVFLLTPLVLCPLVFPYSQTSQESKCAGVIALMAVYWITESLPLPITSLLPIALCPLLGIASSKQMCAAFFGDVTFVLIGGITVAIAIEQSQLHKRIALKILMAIGAAPRKLMLGIMVTTAFLSMWISNTATTAMMMPITRALLAKLFSTNKMAQRRLEDKNVITGDAQSPTEAPIIIESFLETNSKDILPIKESIELYNIGELAPASKADGIGHHLDQEYGRPQEDDTPSLHHMTQGHFKQKDCQLEVKDRDGCGGNHFSVNESENLANVPEEEDEKSILQNLDPQGLATLRAFSLCVCYSANIGGMATLTGTAPNMVYSKMVADMSKTSLVNFANWFAFSLPTSVIILAGSYLWMNISVFGFRSTLTCKATATEEEIKRTADAIQREYNKLGKIRFNEVVVLLHFLILVGLWLTRDLGSIRGWASFFPDKYVSDGSAALAIAVCLFIFPNERPNVLFFRHKGDMSPSRSTPSILSWKDASCKFPWSVIFLLGGGFALSQASKVSGFTKVLANNLMFISTLPLWTASVVVTALTSLATEITSNTVIVMLVLPLLKDVAVALHVNPMYLMLPATLAASLAFMLPVATPPNSLVFAYGDLRTVDMLKAGVVLNIIGVASVTLAINTWGFAIFDLGTFPAWAVPQGGTQEMSNLTITTAFLNFTTAA